MRPLLRWLGRLILIGLGLLLALQLYFFLAIGWWSRVNPSSTSFMRAGMETLHEKNPKAPLQFIWADYSQISNNLKRAVITSEDAKFAEHDGVDWGAIEKAYENNLKAANNKKPRIKGGSTITQQLAKNLFLSGERSYVRKAQELVITYMLEFWMSKERILEIYLNVAEWGNGVYGAEAAARHYFGISAAQLSAGQAARLAGMLPRPRFYDVNRGSGYLDSRTAAILRYMGDAELP
jgi:monofunctional biosynthetic peptidoglycan transglycosylase